MLRCYQHKVSTVFLHLLRVVHGVLACLGRQESVAYRLNQAQAAATALWRTSRDTVNAVLTRSDTATGASKS